LGSCSKVNACGVIDVGTVSRLAIYQAMQQVQHMRFGRDALIQSQFPSPDNDLLIVMKNECENVDHLTIAAGTAKHRRWVRDGSGAKSIRGAGVGIVIGMAAIATLAIVEPF
jgi:hypothetical protein